MTAVLKYDEACRAVAAARTFDEVRGWEDKAAAVIEYGRRAKNRTIEIGGLEIRARSRRRRGELLLELKAAGRLVEGRPKTVTEPGQFLTLDDLEVSRNESSRDQKIAGIEGDSYERLVARIRAHLEAEPEAHSFDVLRERDGPINGARSIMGSRQEPDDSLDFFPTPPFATRALVERVFPRIGVAKIGSVWEPACGEGHMAEVLREYTADVHATDIFDYGYGVGNIDFLDPGMDAYQADWIITNPPFGDLAESFVLTALKCVNVGVAMFMRLQWLESIGRCERIFQPHPPTIVAQFAERVPLHKGRYEPEGGTATAYLWIVWMPHRVGGHRTELFWIPKCRPELTRDDDAERFTTHPVVSRPRPVADDDPPFDPVTGEIGESDSDEADIPAFVRKGHLQNQDVEERR